MNRPLHIAILGTRGIPNAYGGFEQCAQYLSEGLTARGHNLTVYCSMLHPYKASFWNHVQLVHISDPSAKIGSFGQFIYDLKCIMHARRQSYDVIIQMGYTSSSVWKALWPAQSAHMVNMDGIEHLRSKYGLLTKLFLRLAEDWATHKADVLIADNPGIKSRLERKYSDSTIRYIPYGAELSDNEKIEITALKRWNLKASEYDLVICRIEPENNVELIADAYCESDCKRTLVVVGNADNSYGKRLKSKFIDRQVLFAGGIYDKSVLDALRYYCAFYFHGHSVGGTNPSLLEAMALSRNIVAHDNPFNRSILSENGYYFREKGEIVTLLNNPTKDYTHTLMLHANRQILAAEFTWRSVVDAYEKACYEAIAR